MAAHRQLTPATGLGFVAILVWCLLPVVWIVMLSFKPATETQAGSPQFLPKDWTWDNFEAVWKDDDFRRALINSFGISGIATVLSVIIATLCAYAIARLEFKGKRVVLSIALAIAMFPVVSLVGPLFDMWTALGLFDTWLGLIIPYMSFTFRKVIVPLAAPGVFTAAILTFFFAWNDFVFGISLTSTPNARPVPAQLAFFVGPDQFNPPVSTLSAAAIVVTIPIIVIVLLFQRRIVAGLTSGAVKG
jgi:multiple sugar transport system permease protein